LKSIIIFCFYFLSTIVWEFGPRKESSLFKDDLLYGSDATYGTFEPVQFVGFFVFWLFFFLKEVFSYNGKIKIDDMLLLLLFPMIISSFISFNYYSILYILAFVSIVYFINQFHNKFFNKTTQKYFLLLPLFLFISLYYHLFLYEIDYISGRYLGNIRPVNAGLIAWISTYWIFQISLNRYLRAFSVITSLFFCFAVLTRGPLIYLLFFLWTYFLIYVWSNKKFNIYIPYAFIMIFIIIFLYIVNFENINVFGDLLNQVFAINDPLRGLGSGFTGRSYLWQTGLDAWKQNILFGVGVRNLTSNPHMAYIEHLAQFGIVGFLTLIIFFVKLIILSLKKINSQYDYQINAALSFTISFLVLCFFERNLINLSSPTSTTLYFAIAHLLHLKKI
jgi:O-antigen ligase